MATPHRLLTVRTHAPHARRLDLESPWRKLPVDHFTGLWNDRKDIMTSGSENTLTVPHSSASSMAPRKEGESPDVLESRPGS
ncbi:hypothetical protein LEMLEM_LOCUS4922 [Lemmus lemmus]